MPQILYLPQPTSNVQEVTDTPQAPAPAAPAQGGNLGTLGLGALIGGGATLYGQRKLAAFRAGRAAPAAPAASPTPDAAPAAPDVPSPASTVVKPSPVTPKTGFGPPTDLTGGRTSFGNRTSFGVPAVPEAPIGGVPSVPSAPVSGVPSLYEPPIGGVPATGYEGVKGRGLDAYLQFRKPAGLSPPPGPMNGPPAPAIRMPGPTQIPLTMGDEGPVPASAGPETSAPSRLSTYIRGLRNPGAALDESPEAMAMAGEGGGSGMGRIFNDISGSMPIKVAGNLAKGVGGAAALATGVGENGIIPLATGQGLAAAGQSAVRNAGPLASLVEPGLAHMVAQSIKGGEAPAFIGAKALGAGALGSAARLADSTGIPGAVGGIAGYLAHGLGLDGGGQAQAAPAAPQAQAAQPADGRIPGHFAHQAPTGHSVLPGGVLHPSTHSLEDFVNAAGGMSNADAQRMFAMQHYLDPRSQAVQALENMYANQAAHTGDNRAITDFLTKLTLGPYIQPEQPQGQ